MVGKGVTGWGVGRGVTTSSGHGGQPEDTVGGTLGIGFTSSTGARVGNGVATSALSEQMVGT